MSVRLQCAQEHEWDSTAAVEQERCPQCGGAAVSADGSATPFGVETVHYAPADPPSPPLAKGGIGGVDLQAVTLGPDEPAWVLPAGPRPRIGDFQVIDEIGRGGMGVVYKAEQLSLKRPVALKMILAGNHAARDHLNRFRNEAEAVARLQHPNIVQIYQIGDHEGKPFLALEYVDGGTLAHQISSDAHRRVLSFGGTAGLTECLARAVHHAHLRNIIHRDLKPGNVLLMADGTPKITDFGLAKQLQGDTPVTASGAATVTGTIMGTPSYMAPEQADGKRRVIGPAADIYSLGAILYELITGQPPFKGDSPMSTAIKVVTEEPVLPHRLQPRVPRDLETICQKCLEKDPAKRYATAEALADDLRRFALGEPIAARRVGVLGRAGRWFTRRWKAAAFIAAGFVLAFVFLMVLGILVGDGTQDPEAKQDPAAATESTENERDLQRFQGEWAIIGAEENGEKAPPEVLKSARLICTGNQFTYSMPGPAGPIPGQSGKAMIQLNASRTPHEVDFMAAGVEAGKPGLMSGRGIYQWKEDDPDAAIICFAPDDGPRPTDFTAKLRSGRVMITIKRIKPAAAKSDQLLQGKWRLVSGLMNGLPIPEHERAVASVEMAGTTFRLRGLAPASCRAPASIPSKPKSCACVSPSAASRGRTNSPRPRGRITCCSCCGAAPRRRATSSCFRARGRPRAS